MPNKRKTQSRVKVNELDKPNKKLTKKEQKNVKGGLISTTVGGTLSNTIGGTLSNTVGGTLSNTIGGALGNTVGGGLRLP